MAAPHPLSEDVVRAQVVSADFSREQTDCDLVTVALEPDLFSIGAGMLLLVPDKPLYLAAPAYHTAVEALLKAWDDGPWHEKAIDAISALRAVHKKATNG